MQPAVYVPTERPPIQRLYIIRDGVALHKGHKKTKGDSWGAEDVLLRSANPAKCYRALAVTYLHVLWIGNDTFDSLGKTHREAYMLTKLWATIFAAGEAMLDLRRGAKERTPIHIGHGDGEIRPSELEQRINRRLVKVVVMRKPDGQRVLNAFGQPLYVFKYRAIELGGYEIVREDGVGGDQDQAKGAKRGTAASAKRVTYRLVERSQESSSRPLEGGDGGGSFISQPTPIGGGFGEVVEAALAQAPAPAPAPHPTPDSETTALAARVAALTARLEAQAHAHAESQAALAKAHAEGQQAVAAELQAMTKEIEALAGRAGQAAGPKRADREHDPGQGGVFGGFLEA
jgi:hypothetical protein